MADWLKSRWADIRGNFWWFVFTGVALGAWSMLTELWQRLPFWDVVSAMCLFISGWIIVICLLLERKQSKLKIHSATTVPATQNATDFLSEPINDLVDDVSGVSIDFTRTGPPISGITAEIIFVNDEGFEVERIPQGWWLEVTTDHSQIDFATSQTRRLSIAVKDIGKNELHATTGTGSTKVDVNIGSASLDVYVTLKGIQVPNRPISEQYKFRLEVMATGKLRLLKQVELGSNT